MISSFPRMPSGFILIVSVHQVTDLSDVDVRLVMWWWWSWDCCSSLRCWPWPRENWSHRVGRRLSRPGGAGRSNKIRRRAGFEARFDERVFSKVNINFGSGILVVVVVAFRVLNGFLDFGGIALIGVDLGPETKFVLSEKYSWTV